MKGDNPFQNSFTKKFKYLLKDNQENSFQFIHFQQC